MEIKECPWCKSNNTEVSPLQDRDGILIYSGKCLECKARGPYAFNPSDAANKWNTRSAPARLLDEKKIIKTLEELAHKQMSSVVKAVNKKGIINTDWDDIDAEGGSLTFELIANTLVTKFGSAEVSEDLKAVYTKLLSIEATIAQKKQATGEDEFLDELFNDVDDLAKFVGIKAKIEGDGGC